VIEQSLSD